jgi:urease accessory protein
MLIFEEILLKGKDSQFDIKGLVSDSETRKSPLILALTAEERSRTRYRFDDDLGNIFLIRLPRGTLLEQGDLLQSKTGELLKIEAKAENVLTITSSDTLQLMKVIYHLANRHCAMEITTDYLRISFDPVLEKMAKDFGLEVIQEKVPFYPEKGAYQH